MISYQFDGPTLISFSGGRTSAYMLYMALMAYDGRLPDDTHVTFANTGWEREETLRFVHECQTRWGVKIHWLEWKDREGRKTPAIERFDEVGLNSASRNGEPLRALFRRKKYLPNAVTRFCTAEAKIDTMKQFMLSRGYKKWTNVVGLRRDEMHRVFKQVERNESGKERWQTIMPMATVDGQVASRDIWQFWLGNNANPKNLLYPLPQGFDLGLYPWEGNCTACFLKGRDVLIHTERENPGILDDWIAAEEEIGEIASNPNGAQFVTEYSMSDLKAEVERSPLLIPIDPMSLEMDAECGLHCAGDPT